MPAWASRTLAIGTGSLAIGAVGFYADMAYHVDLTRSPSLLSLPHVLAVIGIAGVGLAATVGLLTVRRAEPALVVITVLFCFLVAGFIADQVWHARFGPDLSLWTPSHLLLGSLTLVPLAMWVIAGRATGVFARQILLVGWGAGALVGLTAWQVEFLVAVPLVPHGLHPILVVAAGTVVCVAARGALGRGGAGFVTIAALLLHLVIFGVVALLGRTAPHLSLYAGSAIAAELVPLRLRPVLRGSVVGIGGLLGDALWQMASGRRPWAVSLVAGSLGLAAVVGWAGTLLGDRVGDMVAGPARALQRGPTSARSRARSVAAGVVLVASFMLSGARSGTSPIVAEVETVRVADGIVVTARVSPRSAASTARWFEVLNHRGGRTTTAPMQEVGDGWVSRGYVPTPVGSRTLLRLQTGRAVLAAEVVPGASTLRPEGELWTRPDDGTLGIGLALTLGVVLAAGCATMVRAAQHPRMTLATQRGPRALPGGGDSVTP